MSWTNDLVLVAGAEEDRGLFRGCAYPFRGVNFPRNAAEPILVHLLLSAKAADIQDPTPAFDLLIFWGSAATTAIR